MKYSYAYKTSDGTRHEDSMEANSREEVFAALRTQGIKAIKVVAADGSKANGAPAPVASHPTSGAKIAFIASGLVIGAIIAAFLAFKAGETAQSTKHQSPITACDRHQVYGDPATIQEIESGSIPIATNAIEKFLIAYAIPGKALPVGTLPSGSTVPVGTVPSGSTGTVPSGSAGTLPAGSTVPVGTVPASVDANDLIPTPLSPDDRPEVTAYKQILNGLKAEAQTYLAGGGTWRNFVRELNERQQREIEIYERTRRELESVTDPTLRDERNSALRAMGLRTIPRPRK